MNRHVRRLGSALPLSLALVGTLTTPAAAHGSCSVIADTPFVGGAGPTTISYFAQMNCSETHESYITACLQKRTLNGAWVTISCAVGHGLNTTHVHAQGSTNDVCIPELHDYRVTADGRNAANTHSPSDISSSTGC